MRGGMRISEKRKKKQVKTKEKKSGCCPRYGAGPGNRVGKEVLQVLQVVLKHNTKADLSTAHLHHVDTIIPLVWLQLHADNSRFW